YGWIWLIVFLPVVGCLVYLFSEMFTRREVDNIQSNLGAIINPRGKIKELEERLRFTDTFQNRVLLADAYLDSGNSDKAIELYESCISSSLPDNHVPMQLMLCYFEKERYADVVKMAEKVIKSIEFSRSRSKLIYALSLEKIGKHELAEQQFKSMNGRFSNHENRIYYGQFLLRAGRVEEAKEVFSEMNDEVSHLNGRERRANRTWYAKAKEELDKLNAPVRTG
ncbi:MAG TPA: hypothetical protein VE978_19810, partial [Chitinophagales bacterium]|nr:hypothetical protein [Chitinophagales bacterium]